MKPIQITRSSLKIFTCSIVSVFLSLPACIMAEDVRLNGATTTINGVVNPYLASVEGTTGYKLVIVGNNTGRGLADLIEGKCDAALTSEPLDIAVMAAKNAGKEIEVSKLQIHVIKNDEIVFIVHPTNTVSELTLAQIKQIHLGTIKNWQEVGGANMPIAVFTDAVTGGTRAMIKKVVLNGEEYGTNCRPLDAVKFVNAQVAEIKGGIGGLGKGFADPKMVKIIKTQKIERPLGLITIGVPSEKVKKVIDAFTAAVK